MPDTNIRVKFIRGTTQEARNHNGLEGELAVDIQNKRVHLHDGQRQGGYILGTSVRHTKSGSNITLDFSESGYYDVNLNTNASINFTGIRNGDLNEMLVRFVNMASRTTTWPSSMRWMLPDGSYTANINNVVPDFSNEDWVVFWADNSSGNVYAKLMR